MAVNVIVHKSRLGNSWRLHIELRLNSCRVTNLRFTSGHFGLSRVTSIYTSKWNFFTSSDECNLECTQTCVSLPSNTNTEGLPVFCVLFDAPIAQWYRYRFWVSNVPSSSRMLALTTRHPLSSHSPDPSENSLSQKVR